MKVRVIIGEPLRFAFHPDDLGDEFNEPAPALNMDAAANPYETLRGVAAELLDPATAAAMLATALRYPLHLAADVALPVVEAVERAWCWADSRATHWAWLLSFLGLYGGAS